MSQPRYTSRNQFANMLERRAKELTEIAARMHEAFGGDTSEAEECIGDACDDLKLAAKWLRDPVRE